MAAEAVSGVEARLEALVDTASLRPLRSAVGDGVVAGSGTVDGVQVFCWAQDGRFRGCALGTAGGETIARVLSLAERAGAPVVGFPESGGARVQEGVAALSAHAALFRAQGTARVALFSVVTGACAGGAAYACALGDLTIAAGPDTRLFLTGPAVVREVTREEVDGHALGGPRVQGANGVVHLQADDDAHAARLARQVLGYIPPRDVAPRPPAPRDPAEVLPPSPRAGSDVRAVAARIVDGGELLELAPRWARNLVTALARVE